MSYEDAQGAIDSLIKVFRAFLKRAQGFPDILRDLGKVLETPEILQEAERAEKRIEDVLTLLKIAETADSYLDTLLEDYYELADRLALKGSTEGIVDDDVWNLPQFIKTRDLGDTCRKVTSRLRREGLIDWALEGYIGETGIWKELHHKSPEEDLEDFRELTINIYGALETLNAETLTDLVDAKIEEGQP